MDQNDQQNRNNQDADTTLTDEVREYLEATFERFVLAAIDMCDGQLGMALPAAATSYVDFLNDLVLHPNE
jgi:hypothetical protein